MKKLINIILIVLGTALNCVSADEEIGFVNIINGTDRPIKLLLDGKPFVGSLPQGDMSGGMSLPAGRVKLTAEAEGIKDESTPITIIKDKSQLVIVGMFKNNDDPPKDVMRIQPVPYQNEAKGGFSASLIYAGQNEQSVINIGDRRLVLKRYEYVEVGPVSSSFGFKNDKGESYTTDFYEPVHYTLVVLDGNVAGNIKVLVVPNHTYQKPVF